MKRSTIKWLVAGGVVCAAALALSPEGFAGEDGLYGVNQNLDGVRGQEPLVEYLKELADKYEIPLAE